MLGTGPILLERVVEVAQYIIVPIITHSILQSRHMLVALRVEGADVRSTCLSLSSTFVELTVLYAHLRFDRSTLDPRVASFAKGSISGYIKTAEYLIVLFETRHIIPIKEHAGLIAQSSWL